MQKSFKKKTKTFFLMEKEISAYKIKAFIISPYLEKELFIS